MRAFRGLALAALYWRWWSIAALLELALALPPALLWDGWMRGALSNHYAPGELFGNLTTNFRFDNRTEMNALGDAAGLWMGFAALLAMLLGAFFAGGWTQLAFDGKQGPVVARAGTGARRFFWRYVRVWLVTLALLALWSWLMFDWPWRKVVLDWILELPASGGDRLEALTSEWSAVAVRLTQAGIYALGVALLLCCADYVRLRLAWKDGRSALLSWGGALAMVLRAPFKTLAPLTAIFVVEVVILCVVSWFSRRFEGQISLGEAGMGTVWLLVATTVVLAMLRCWLRGARYLAAAEVVRETVRRVR